MASHKWECPRCGIAYYWKVGFNSNAEEERDIHNHLQAHRRSSKQIDLLGREVSDSMEIRLSKHYRQEGLQQDMKIGEAASKISFRTTPSITVEYDPQAEFVEKAGQGGKNYKEVQLKVLTAPWNGKIAIVPISERLLAKLQPYTSTARLKITRTGDSFSTDYTVEAAK